MNKISGYKGQRLKRPYYGGGRQKLNLTDEEWKIRKENLRQARELKKKRKFYFNVVQDIIENYKVQSGLNHRTNPIIVRSIALQLEDKVRITERK